MKNFLIIDSALSSCNIICRYDSAIAEKRAAEKKLQAEHLLTMIDSVFDTLKCSMANIDLLAVVNGPGSFTGVRMACAVTQALVYVNPKPVVLLSSLQLIAEELRQAIDGEKVLILKNAFMGQVFAGLYQIDADIAKPIFADKLMNPESVNKLAIHSCHLYGDGFNQYADLLPKQIFADNKLVLEAVNISADTYIRLAELEASENATVSLQSILPKYLRDKSAWQ